VFPLNFKGNFSFGGWVWVTGRIFDWAQFSPTEFNYDTHCVSRDEEDARGI